MKTVKQSIDFQTLIRKLSPFRTLSDEGIRDLEQRFTYRRFAAGTMILGPSKKSDELYLIRNGRAHVVLNDVTGQDILLHSLGSGEIFGKPLPSERGQGTTSVIITEETNTLVLGKNELAAHLVRFPETSMIFLRVMADRLEETYENLACLSLGDVTSRFHRLLTKLAQREGMNVGDGIMLPKSITQTDMAKMIGARRETISRLISQFVSQGVVKRRGRALILAEVKMAG
ncbi:Crp/Fnr family transcriptional regulator [Myxococcota bacterium]|nr:Crp/Fnr family transcriptional regulator [Myxococcota bacterium]MBU1537202.1 Crp/Fnr family transcriptional regulator [Myxococcota bacterium]